LSYSIFLIIAIIIVAGNFLRSRRVKEPEEDNMNSFKISKDEIEDADFEEVN